jgi:kynurenine formamidase
MISFSSHAGTHVDAPLHFCCNSRSIRDLFQTMNIFYPTYCLDIPIKDDKPIQSKDIHEKLPEKSDAQALLIRTGSCYQRTEQPDQYAVNHPWVHAEVADYLRKMCPDLRLMGIDTISISVPSHRNEGHQSHRAFLCDDRPILLLEDADLSFTSLTQGVYTLYIIPYLIEVTDGIPVVGLMEINH